MGSSSNKPNGFAFSASPERNMSFEELQGGINAFAGLRSGPRCPAEELTDDMTAAGLAAPAVHWGDLASWSGP
jgi:hypothetical protein